VRAVANTRPCKKNEIESEIQTNRNTSVIESDANICIVPDMLICVIYLLLSHSHMMFGTHSNYTIKQSV